MAAFLDNGLGRKRPTKMGELNMDAVQPNGTIIPRRIPGTLQQAQGMAARTLPHVLGQPIPENSISTIPNPAGQPIRPTDMRPLAGAGSLVNSGTPSGQYANQVAGNGLMTNEQVSRVQGYMPNKTVGGAWGSPGSLPLPFEKKQLSGQEIADRIKRNPGLYGPNTFLNRPKGGPAEHKLTQEYLDKKFAGRYKLNEEGQVMPTESELATRAAKAASPEVQAETVKLGVNREAYLANRQAKSAAANDARLAIASKRGAGRRQRLENRKDAANLQRFGPTFEQSLAFRDPRADAFKQGITAQSKAADADRMSRERMAGERLGLERSRLGSIENMSKAEREARALSEDKRLTSAKELQAAQLGGQKELTGLTGKQQLEAIEAQNKGAAERAKVANEPLKEELDLRKGELDYNREQSNRQKIFDLMERARALENQNDHAGAADLRREAESLRPALAAPGKAGAAAGQAAAPEVPWQRPGVSFSQLPQVVKAQIGQAAAADPEQLPTVIRQHLGANADTATVDGIIREVTGKSTASAYDPGGYGLSNFLGEATGLENINRIFGGNRDVPMAGGMPQIAGPADIISKALTGRSATDYFSGRRRK